MAARLIPLAVAALLLGAALGDGLRRVARRERREQVRESPPASLDSLAGTAVGFEGSARLLALELDAGERVVAELCSRDGLPPERWREAVEVVLWAPRLRRMLLRGGLGADALAAARRSPSGAACVTVGEAAVAAGGTYAYEVAWPRGDPAASVRAAPVVGRLLVYRPLAPVDAAPIALGLLGALGLAGSLGFRRRGAGRARGAPFDDVVAFASLLRGGPLFGPLGGALVAFGAFAALALVVSRLAASGAAATIASSFTLMGVEVTLALVLVSAGGGLPSRLDGLGVHAPAPAAWKVIPVTLLTSVALLALARLSVLLVPRTVESDVRALLAMPSGVLAFSVVAVCAPVAEEVFFRGLLYGKLARLGDRAAVLGSAGLFLLAHLPQTWGSWGAVLSIATTGVVLGALRAWSGSITAGLLAHLAYNALLLAA